MYLRGMSFFLLNQKGDRGYEGLDEYFDFVFVGMQMYGCRGV